MGESGRDALRVGFDGSLKLEFHDSNMFIMPRQSRT